MTGRQQSMQGDRSSGEPLKKPDWLRVRLAQGPVAAKLRRLLADGRLHTVCEEALCPNRGQCWEHGRATVMILGDTCTRHCRFCNVSSRQPPEPFRRPSPVMGGAHQSGDSEEPVRVARAIAQMGLKDVVLTSVTRDDLADGGAATWAETIRRVREAVRGIVVEVLIPDFRGDAAALRQVLDARPDVLGHNLETVPSLYGRVRPGADYRTSLAVIARAHEAGLITKTGMMVGLGETAEEVLNLMDDAVKAGCEIFYVGQYLRPTAQHLAVQRYVPPDEFDAYRDRGLQIGFKVVVSGPLVRSSYHDAAQAEYVQNRRGIA